MLINIDVLIGDFLHIDSIPVEDLCHTFAMLGFPVNEVKNYASHKIFDMDITSNRGDVQSHYGLARDLAAKLNVKLDTVPECTIESGKSLVDIYLNADDVVPYYTAAVMDLTINNSLNLPNHISYFLKSIDVEITGFFVVDVANSILYKYGYPLHVFDFDKVKGDITVRWAMEGETLVTLDYVERKLTSRDLVIADCEGPIALAGVLGGYRTRVTNITRRILIESAYFTPNIIQNMSYRHNLHTDASQRFSRGVDPEFAIVARNLLINVLQDYNQARLIAAWVIGKHNSKKYPVKLPMDLLEKSAGYKIGIDFATSVLRRLGCEIYIEEQTLVVKVPTWRYDLNIANDLVEEVLRINGYDNIPLSLPVIDSPPLSLDCQYIRRRKLAKKLAYLGFFQAVTFSFTNSRNDRLNATNIIPDQVRLRTIRNPLGEEYSVMRDTLLPDLARVVKLNLDRGVKDVRVFEIASTFHANQKQFLSEVWTLGIVWAGQSGGNDPLSKTRDISKPEGQSYFIGILKSIGISNESIKKFSNWQLIDDSDSKVKPLGWQFEIAFSDIEINEQIIPRFIHMSKFPIVERDLSILVNICQQYDFLQRKLLSFLHNLEIPIKSITCIDAFNVSREHQSWLMHFTFQAMDRTLTNDEVDRWMTMSLSVIEQNGASLRR